MYIAMMDGNYDIVQLVLLVAIATLVVISGVLSTVGKIMDKRYRGIKKIRRAGWWFFAVNLAVIILTVGQFICNRENDRLKGERQAADQQKRDKEQRDSYDRNTARLMKIILDHGYKVDNENERLARIVKDSSKTRVILPQLPVLYLKNVESTGRNALEEAFNVEIWSENAGSTNISADLFVIGVASDGEWIPFGIMRGWNEQTIPADRGIETGMILHERRFPLIKFYFYLSGTYTGIGSSTLLNVNQTARYMFIDSQFVNVVNSIRDSIVRFCKENKSHFPRT